MAITAITDINNSNHISYYATNYTNTAKKDSTRTKDNTNTKDNAKIKDSTNTKGSNVVTTTVELKTSIPGVTKTEQIKTDFRNVNDYSKYLQEKYDYMNIGTTSMEGIPTTVSVSSEFLKKCMNDPEKAKYLEENLAAIPDCVKSAIHGCLGTLTNLSYNFDANGNITIAGSGTNDPDGKIARENAERKARESREKEKKIKEKQKKKRAAKKAQEKAAKEAIKEAAQKAAKETNQRVTKEAAKEATPKAAKETTKGAVKEKGKYTVTAKGRNVKAITHQAILASKGMALHKGTGFNVTV